MNINQIELGDKVKLNKEISSQLNLFKKGQIVTIVGSTPNRGFTFQDNKGNIISEAGYDCELYKKGDPNTFTIKYNKFNSEVIFNVPNIEKPNKSEQLKYYLRDISQRFSIKTEKVLLNAIHYIEELEKEINELKSKNK